MKKVILGIMLLISVLATLSCTKATPGATLSPAEFPASEPPVAMPSIPAPQTTLPPPENEGLIVLPEVPTLIGPTTTPGEPGLPPVMPPGRQNVYSVQLDLVPSRLVYLPGEQVDMELTLVNASQGDVGPVVVSGLPPEIDLVPAGVQSGASMPPDILPGMTSGAPVKVFPAGTGERTLAMGEKVTYNFTWDQKDGNGNQVASGWYFYEFMISFRPESWGIGSGSGGRDRAFFIQYPQGAMHKTIEVNQAKTVTGLPLEVNGETKLVDVTIELQRVELDDMGATFYAVMSSADNPLSGYDNEWMGRIPFNSQYIIDGVVKDARAPNSQFADSGVLFRWGASPDDDNYLDPVPSDAKKLTFIIPGIGQDWQGPWEFDIPLQ